MIHLTDRIQYVLGDEADYIESQVGAFCGKCSIPLSDSLSKDDKTLKFLIKVSPAGKKPYCIVCARTILKQLIEESRETLFNLDSLTLKDLFEDKRKKTKGGNNARRKKKNNIKGR